MGISWFACGVSLTVSIYAALDGHAFVAYMNLAAFILNAAIIADYSNRNKK